MSISLNPWKYCHITWEVGYYILEYVMIDLNMTTFVACITLDSACIQELSLFVQYQKIVEQYHQSKDDITQQYVYERIEKK